MTFGAEHSVVRSEAIGSTKTPLRHSSGGEAAEEGAKPPLELEPGTESHATSAKPSANVKGPALSKAFFSQWQAC